MIRAAAVGAAVVAEGLAAYVFAEWVASGYESGEQHAVRGVFFVLVALIGFVHLRAAEWLALSRRATFAFAGSTAFVVLYGILRLEFAADFALWDFGWVGEFLSDTDAVSQRAGRPLLAAMLLLPLWARCAWRSGDEVDLETMSRQLAIPFGAVTILLVLGIATSRTGEVGRAGATFYAVAVLALALSQSALSGATIGDVRAGGVTAALLGGIAAATIVALGVAAVVFAVLGPLLGPPLGATIEQVLTWVLTPPAWLLERLFHLLLQGNDPFPDLTNTVRTGAQDAEKGPAGRQNPLARISAFALRILALAIIATLVAAGIALATRLRRRTITLRAALDVASAGSPGEDLRSFFRSLFRRGSGSHPTAPGSSAAVRLYRQVLDDAAGRGHPKPPADTAREFAPVLTGTFHTGVTDEITAAFQEARYAGREPDPRTLADLEGRWKTLRGR